MHAMMYRYPAWYAGRNVYALIYKVNCRLRPKLFRAAPRISYPAGYNGNLCLRTQLVSNDYLCSEKSRLIRALLIRSPVVSGVDTNNVSAAVFEKLLSDVAFISSLAEQSRHCCRPLRGSDCQKAKPALYAAVYNSVLQMLDRGSRMSLGFAGV